MDLICTAVLSLICLQAPLGETTIVISNVGLGQSAAVSGGDWEATLGLMVDHLDPLGPTRLRACDGPLCIAYRADCEPERLDCNFVVDGGPSLTTTIGIKAQSMEAMASARQSLAIVIDRNGVRGLRLEKLASLDELASIRRNLEEHLWEQRPDPRRIAAEEKAKKEHQRRASPN